MDAGRSRIRAYMHHYKIYNQKEQGWSVEGPYELYILWCAFPEMVRGSMSSKRNMFHDKATTTVKKYFVMDAVLDWAGNAGLGIIGTNARNRLQKDIEPLYLHK